MKKILLFISLITVLMSCSESSDTRGKIQWIESYSQGSQQASTTGKPIMLYFSATWCGYCRKLAQKSLSNSKVVNASTQLVNIYVDIDRDQKTRDRYGIRGVPTILFLDYNTRKIKESSEMWQPNSFVTEINSIVRNYHR